MSAFLSAAAARYLDEKRPSWPLLKRLLVASLTTPVAYSAFLLLIALPVAMLTLSDRARALKNLPSYLREAILIPDINLWICGAICVAILGCFGGSPSAHRLTSRRGSVFLVVISVVAQSAILAPMAMEFWLRTGRIAFPFMMWLCALGFLVGGLPLAGLQIVSLRQGGAPSLRRAQRFIPAYAMLIAGGGYLWHGLIAERPGGWSAWLLTTSALTGVMIGWFNGRRALHVAELRRFALQQPNNQNIHRSS